MPVPRLAVEQRGPQRLHPVRAAPQPRPTHAHLSGGRAQRVDLHLARRRRVASRSSRRPTCSPVSATAAAPPTTTRSSACTARRSRLHPQYVLENGVDFAHFKFVHKTPIVPVFTRHDFADAGVLRRLHHHLRGRRRAEDRRRQQRRRGHQRRPGHRGDQELGHDRQPDHLRDHPRRRRHVRRALHGVHRPRRPARTPATGRDRRPAEFGDEVIRQFAQDVHIWSHQRYSDPPALSTSEYEGFTAIRKWAMQFYPDGRGGSAADLRTPPTRRADFR